MAYTGTWPHGPEVVKNTISNFLLFVCLFVFVCFFLLVCLLFCCLLVADWVMASWLVGRSINPRKLYSNWFPLYDIQIFFILNDFFQNLFLPFLFLFALTICLWVSEEVETTFCFDIAKHRHSSRSQRLGFPDQQLTVRYCSRSKRIGIRFDNRYSVDAIQLNSQICHEMWSARRDGRQRKKEIWIRNHNLCYEHSNAFPPQLSVN